MKSVKGGPRIAPPPSRGERPMNGPGSPMGRMQGRNRAPIRPPAQQRPSGYARPDINNYARRGIQSQRTPEPVVNPNAPETMYGGPNTFGRRQIQRPYGMATMRPSAGGSVDPRAIQIRQAMMLRGR